LDKKYRESTSFEKAIKYQHQLLNKNGEGKNVMARRRRKFGRL